MPHVLQKYVFTLSEKANFCRLGDVGKDAGHSTPEVKRAPLRCRHESQWQVRPCKGSFELATSALNVQVRQRQVAVIVVVDMVLKES